MQDRRARRHSIQFQSIETIRFYYACRHASECHCIRVGLFKNMGHGQNRIYFQPRLHSVDYMPGLFSGGMVMEPELLKI